MPILKRNGRMLGPVPDMALAELLAANLNRGRKAGDGLVTVEMGSLEAIELERRKERACSVDSKPNGNGIRTADSK